MSGESWDHAVSLRPVGGATGGGVPGSGPRVEVLTGSPSRESSWHGIRLREAESGGESEEPMRERRTGRAWRADRRRFLATAAAAATVTVVRPELVRGSEANSRIRAGLIGAGGRGRLIARKMAEHGGYHLEAVADYFPEVATAAGDELGVPKGRRYSGLLGYRRLIDSGVDAVFLETPPYCFPRHAAAAVDAGCHVYMAKPLACDVPGTLAVREAARKAGRRKQVFLVDFQTRTHPLNIEVVRRAHAGALGRIGLISSCYTDDGFSDPPLTETIESRLRGLVWVHDIALGGGYIANCAIHAIDIGIWLLGKPPVSATGASAAARRDPHGDTHDVYSVTYRCADGAVWSHRGEHIRNGHGFKCFTQAFGQDAWLEASYEGQVALQGGDHAYEGGTVENLYATGIETNLKTFHRCVTDGRHDNPTVEPSVQSTLATLLGQQACFERREVTWEEMLRRPRRAEADLTGLRE